MHADKTNKKKIHSRPAGQQTLHNSAIRLQDNRPKSAIQLKQAEALATGTVKKATIQQKENRTGLPDQLKAGIENLSGHSMDDVKVHYNSDKPAQLNAHAYAQGTEIHLASGQEKHLPHEAWHVAQQKQGRVKATMQMKETININDDRGLEKEADVMGQKAFAANERSTDTLLQRKAFTDTIQLVTDFEKPDENHSKTEAGIFGIGPAGWVFLGQAHHGKTQYGWDNQPVAEGDNAYSLQTFFEAGWKTLTADNKMALISHWVSAVVDDLDPPKVIQIRAELARGVKVSKIIEREVGGGEAGFVQFVNWAKTQTEANAQMKAGAGKVESIKADAQKEAFFHSKQGLVAILQKNVELYYQGKPLIPTYIAIRKEDSDPTSHFVPDMKGTRDKSTTYTTDKEIRMIYKLTQEAPDAKLRYIAQKTFFFQHQDAKNPLDRKFENIPAPWEHMDTDFTSKSTGPNDNYTHNTVKKWQERARKLGRASYKNRADAHNPLWMKELINYRAQQEAGHLALQDKSGLNVTYAISKDQNNLIIKSTVTSQVGLAKQKTTTISLKDLITMKIEFEEQKGKINVNIKKPDADYEMLLSPEQASQFKLLIKRINDENTKMVTENAGAEGIHKLAFNLKTLKLERNFTTQMGINKLTSSEIDLADIKSVSFSNEDKKIEIEISSKTTYIMLVSRKDAESVRELLLRSGLNARVIGPIPLPTI